MLGIFDKIPRLPHAEAQSPCPREPNPNAKRSWKILGQDSKVLAIHAALLRTGKVIFISGSGNSQRSFDKEQFLSAIWDYPHADKYGIYGIVSTETDVFCCGHSFLPNGNLLVAGGTLAWQNTDRDKGPRRGYAGSRSAYMLDTNSEKLTAIQNMRDGRWYPSLVTLGNGNIFTISGYSANLSTDNTSKVNPLAEIYSESAGWTLLKFMRPSGELTNEGPNWPLYPHVLSLEDPLLDHPPIRDVHIIDLLAPVSHYMATEKLNFARMQLNAVLLPDRTVFVCGGDSQRGIASTPQMQAEIYNPSTQKWTIAATACVPRLYHSVALLLPDARVITAGSNPGGKHELRLEIYDPPYLFLGRRPAIDKIDQDASYGRVIHIDSPQASSIKWVHIIRPMATTHSYDSEQRLVDLSFSLNSSNRLTANIPNNPNLAPPGWYMLFIVEAIDERNVPRGVPSIAKWVYVSPPQ